MSTKINNNKKRNIKTEQKDLSSFFGYEKKVNYELYERQRRTINKRAKNIVDVPHPFVKWAGGKRQLINQFNKYFPSKFNKYIEPFVGGGAIFFYLLPENAILIDNNEELINCYQVIQNKVDELIKSLKKHKNEKNYFYKVRNVDRTEEFRNWSDVERASRTIFLNRCCFNGLYRVNSNGQFNVPFGKYKNPKFCDEKNLKAVNKALKNVEVIKDSFAKCLKFAEKDDFIYFDPPYHPLSDTANFTGYTKGGFGKKAQIQLFDVFKELDERGCKLMLSNSYNDFILNLYKDYKIKTILAKRAINSDATKRGQIKEALILNQYD
ncbi:MAG: DNA adenine methylase [Candidatus Helarchaeota archaeon]